MAKKPSPTDSLKTRISRAFEQHGVNQTELADMFGVSRQLVSEWMAGKKPIPPKYKPLIEHWCETGLPPNIEDLKNLKHNSQKDRLSLETLEEVGTRLTIAQAAAYFGMQSSTFTEYLDEHRDCKEAFNIGNTRNLTTEMVERCAQTANRLPDIALIAGITIEQLDRVLDTWQEYQDAYDRGLANMRTSILKHQFEIMADHKHKSSGVLAIWLGKQFLGQSDTPAQEKETKAPVREFRFAKTDEEAYKTQIVEDDEDYKTHSVQ